MIRQQAEFAWARHDAQSVNRLKDIRPLTAIEERAAGKVRALAHRLGVTAVAAVLEQFRTIDA